MSERWYKLPRIYPAEVGANTIIQARTGAGQVFGSRTYWNVTSIGRIEKYLVFSLVDLECTE